MGANGSPYLLPQKCLFAFAKRVAINKKYKQPPSQLPTLAAIFV